MTYSLENLSQREKQAIDYKLFGRRIGKHRYFGLVEEHGGRRLGKGCFIVPSPGAETILAVLKEHNVEVSVIHSYVPTGAKKFLSTLFKCDTKSF